MTPFLTSPPSSRRNCGSRRVAPSSVESVDPNVWLGTDHQKFQRSTKSATGLLTLPKHLMYGILCLPTFIMKNQPLIQIYIYIYIFQSHGAYGLCLMNSGYGIKPIRAQVYTGTSPLRRRWNTHLFGWFKSWFYLDMKPQIVKRLLMEKQAELLFRSWTLWWYFVHETIPT